MKPFDEQDLIAYHLQDLSPRRARALERALQTHPQLAAEFEAYAATLHTFKRDVPVTVNEELLARNWNALWPALPTLSAPVSLLSRWRLQVLAGAGFALATTVFVAMHHRESGPAASTVASFHQANRPASSVTPLTTAATSLMSVAAPQNFTHLSTYSARGLALPSTDIRQAAEPHLTARLTYTLEPSAAPHLIPLTPLKSPSLPVGLFGVSSLPAGLSTAISVEPTALPQSVSANGGSKSAHGHSSIHHDHPVDVTLAMGGTLIPSREGSVSSSRMSTWSATHAVSAIGSFHQQLRPAVGYRIAMSYTRPDFVYSAAGGGVGGYGALNSRIYELAATYVVQGPHRGFLSTSAEAGGGLMGFLPSMSGAQTTSNVNIAVVAGVSAEFTISKHLALHTAYRAQAFKAPDFTYNGSTIPLSAKTFLSNEPSIGIAYRFNPK